MSAIRASALTGALKLPSKRRIRARVASVPVAGLVAIAVMAVNPSVDMSATRKMLVVGRPQVRPAAHARPVDGGKGYRRERVQRDRSAPVSRACGTSGGEERQVAAPARRPA